MAAAQEKIGLKNVSFCYGARNVGPVLRDVNLSIAAGEFVGIVGPSGCGKSTLLNLVAGLNRPTAGCISIDGMEVTGPGTDRGVVFQHYSLFPWMTARSNLVFALQQGGGTTSRRQLAEKAGLYLQMVGLAEVADMYPGHLSGGMEQRVAIARAFAVDSPILLMDEPFSAVDTRNRVMLQELLLQLWRDGGNRKTVLFITHDIDEAILLSDRVVVMSSQKGSIRADFAITARRPRNRAALLKSTECLELRNRIVELFHDDEAELLADWPGRGVLTEERKVAV